jgi:hypothetical protein
MSDKNLVESDPDPLSTQNPYDAENLSVIPARPETVEAIIAAVKGLIDSHINPSSGHCFARHATVGLPKGWVHLIENKSPNDVDPYVVDISFLPSSTREGEVHELEQGTYFVERHKDGSNELKSYVYANDADDETEASSAILVDDARAQVLRAYLNGSGQNFTT